MNRTWLFSLVLLFGVVGCASNMDRSLLDQRQALNDATATVTKLSIDPEFDPFHQYMQKAKAVLIVPSLYKGAFIFGGEYGNAVLVVRNGEGATAAANNPASAKAVNETPPIAQPAPLQPIQTESLDAPSGNTTTLAPRPLIVGGNSSWGAPLFYSVTGVSAGLQIGGQSSELIFVIMTDKALRAILNNSVKLGADVSVAVGPIGKGLQAATGVTPPSADMYAFGRAAGLYGGVSLSGAVVKEKTAWNLLLYGNGASPAEVMNRPTAVLPEATDLQQALLKAEAAPPVRPQTE